MAAVSNSASQMADLQARQESSVDAGRRVVGAPDAGIVSVDVDLLSKPNAFTFSGADDYFALRSQVVHEEKALDFDYSCRMHASTLEQEVDDIIQALRRRDVQLVYDKAPKRVGYGGQEHRRFPGDHFLSNVGLIGQTALFDIATRMPKGAHLHIHFNACLLPSVLIGIAKTMPRMYITSTEALLPDHDFRAFDKAEIQFSIVKEGAEDYGDIFESTYDGKKKQMPFEEFMGKFRHPHATADEWLAGKLMFQEQEAHGVLQTAHGAWEKFNSRTKMMKGLFNYETAFRTYTRLCLEDFVKDNIQYAEIRPNFMPSNQLYHDDGNGIIDNYGIMEIIIDEVERFQEAKAKEGGFFGGLKVIYCTPRSFDEKQVETALAECLAFKKKWPKWIAGFDLVGEEAAGKPLREFVPQLLAFRDHCTAADLDIPFLFHCGETLDMGTTTDGNLIDALLLNSKRIGHGFALARHPYIMQQMKARGVCVELCPISNEVLGLTSRISGHSMYQLLADNVHCTVSSDNGTLFQSTLSHDFYQVMIGKADMGLFGWKQLILWSLKHACLDKEEKRIILEKWRVLWTQFLLEVYDKYKYVMVATA